MNELEVITNLALLIVGAMFLSVLIAIILGIVIAVIRTIEEEKKGKK